MYSTKQLEGKTKAVLVGLTETLQGQLESLRNAPTTPEQVRATMLNIKRDTALSKERAAANKAAHIERLAEIKVEANHASQKLELEYGSTSDDEAKALIMAFEAIQDKVTKAKADLTFGLEQAQNENDVKINSLNEVIEAAKTKYEEDIVSYKEQVSEAKQEAVDFFSENKVSHNRKLEQVAYDQKIALRDKDEAFIKDVCKELNLVTMTADDKKGFEAIKATDQKDIDAQVAAAVTAAKASVHVSEGTKYSSLKSSTDNQAAIDKNNIANYVANAKSDQARIVALEAQLKEVPGQIAKAVEAAKSAVTVTQDAGKK